MGRAAGAGLAGLLLVAAWGCRSRARRPEPGPPEVLTLVAVGDLLMHQDVKKAALQDPGGFSALWADLIPLFRESDLVFGNLESPVAPTTGRPGVPFQFNAPDSLPAALRASGFSVLATANNHAFDQGPRGVRETLDRLHSENLVAVGSGEDQGRAERVQILERRGFKVAFLAFTDLLNVDLNRRASEPWVRPLDLEPACAAVREARTQADAVVVSLHWGNEYQLRPTQRQRDIARALARAGCDVILGHHPHVLQPVEVLAEEGHRMLVAYSLGNFISNQDRAYRADQLPVAGGDSRDGAALRIRLERLPDAHGRPRLQVASAQVEPLWTENNWGSGEPHRVIRVLRVPQAEARLRSELARLGDPAAGPKLMPEEPIRRRAILEVQERLRTLVLRRRRVAEVVGEAFVSQAGSP